MKKHSNCPDKNQLLDAMEWEQYYDNGAGLGIMETIHRLSQDFPENEFFPEKDFIDGQYVGDLLNAINKMSEHYVAKIEPRICERITFKFNEHGKRCERLL